MQPSKLSEKQVLKATKSLLKYLKKKPAGGEDDNKEQLFGEDDDFIGVQIIVDRPPDPPGCPRKRKSNIIKPIKIKHSVLLDSEICVICGEHDAKRTETMLEETPVSQVKRVISIAELREKFHQYKDKRALCNAYTLFIADDRIIPILTHVLGRYFFSKKKQPVGISMRGQWPARVVKMIHCTFATRPCGDVMFVKMGTSAFTAQELTDNVMMGIEQIVRLVPKGWDGVKSIGIKSSYSPSLTVYHTLKTGK